MSDVIRIDSKELEILDKTNKDIENINQNILIMRKKQLYNQLAEGSKQRVKLLNRITKWIDILEERIFADDVIADMDVNKLISLFKYINNLQIKALAQSDKLEDVLGKYITSGAMDLERGLNDGTVDPKEDLNSIKKEIMGTISKILIKNTSDADIVKNENIIQDADYIELETKADGITDIDNLPEIDIEE